MSTLSGDVSFVFSPAWRLGHIRVPVDYNVAQLEDGVIDDVDRTQALEWHKDIHEVQQKRKILRAACSYKRMNFDIPADINCEIRKYL